MRDVIGGEDDSTGEAKDFVVSLILAETEREGTAISATKRQTDRNLSSPVVGKWNLSETD
jgi:hypothetical protein